MTRFNPHPFRIIEEDPVVAASPGREYDRDDRSLGPMERVERMVHSADLFVFMKGTPGEPRCGFSAHTVSILDAVGRPYITYDVLADPEIRAAAKEYSAWPTFPQVYLNGELVGGNDVITELYETGELQAMLEEVAR